MHALMLSADPPFARVSTIKLRPFTAAKRGSMAKMTIE
jgi:hypothetical protein